MPKLTLISHHLCPYVQRAVIALREKRVPFERIDVDLANKPAWFNTLSPLGKTPVLKAGDVAIFESAVILEYLEETQPLPLHPPDPLRRAEHRSWIEFGSATLDDIADSIRRGMKHLSAGRSANCPTSSRGSNAASDQAPTSTATDFRWWTPFSARSFAISMSSTASATSASLQASPRSPHGAKSWRQDRRSAPPLPGTMTRGYRLSCTRANRISPR